MRKSKSNIICLCGLQWLCLLSVGDLKVNVSSGRMSLRTAATKTKRKSKSNCMSLRTAMVRFFTYRTSDSKCFFRSYVFADCGHEDKRKSKSNIVCLCGLQWLGFSRIGHLTVNVSSGRMRKSKSNIVCLCGLQWLCLLSVGDLKVNVSSGRMSLRTAATKTKRTSKSNIVCLCGLQWLGFSRIGHLTVNVSSGRMSLRTAATKTRENLKAILYVFADCNG